MTTSVDFLLIGGGLASATAAKTLREEGGEGDVIILAAEPVLPYHRPPLTKNYLLGRQTEESTLVHKERYYRDHDLQVLLGTRAIAVYPQDQRVVTDNAGDFRYRKLLIASGCTPKKLEVPGAGLAGIFYLRTISDSATLRQAMPGAKAAGVIGASFIAMELAAAFAEQGIKTTIIAKEGQLYSRLNSPEVGAFFADEYRSRGVEIVFGESVAEFQGKGRVERLITCSGKMFSFDLVAVGVGVAPDIGFLEGSGIKAEDGVLVNQYMQTNISDIYAAGDVANFFDPVFRRHRRIEHWDNAVKQGTIAALNMLGRCHPFRTVSYFFSTAFDLSFNFLGDTAGVTDRVLRGSPKERSFAVLYLDKADGKERLQAMFLMKRPAVEAKAAESLILNHIDLKSAEARLPDASFPLEKLAVQTVLILQGGGALGAFECGVVRALEERGIHPDVVAGVSIGAFNAAIIAAHPKDAAAALEAFWEELTLNTPVVPNEEIRQILSSWQSLMVGSPKFFRPRWLMPILHPGQLPMYWNSFYDPSPVKVLLERYVDFKRLKDSPIRLIISAVNIETAELETFDSYIHTITPDHILASGSLPPGFPWTTIDGRHYWDGGIVSNTPLNQVIELLGCAGKKVYVVNLYPNKKPLPRNIIEVMARRDEIFYAEKIQRDIHIWQLLDRYRQLVEEIMGWVEPPLVDQIKHWPLYIQTMGDAPPFSITRIVHEGEEGELPSKDYDFSQASIERHKREGYRMARMVLDQEAEPLK